MNTPPGINTDWTHWPTPKAFLSWTDANGTPLWLTFDLVESEEWSENAEVTEHPVERGPNVGDHVRVKLVTCSLKVFVSQEPLDAAPFVGSTTQTVALQLPSILELPTPSWVPASGVLKVPQWNNNIEIRALGSALVGLTGALSGRVGQVAGLIGTNAAAALIPGVETATVVATDAGLLPPNPSAPVHPVVQKFSNSPHDFVRDMHAALKALKDAAQLVTLVGRKNVQPNMVIDGLTFTSEDGTGTGEKVAMTLREVRIVRTQVVTAPIPNLSAQGPPKNKGGQTPTDKPIQQQSGLVKAIKAATPVIKAIPSALGF